jgi:hypothetical protein
MWAIGVGQIVRTLRDTVETQKGRQRHPLSDAISSGSGTALQIVPDSMTDAANRDPRCRIHHTHVFSSHMFSFAVEQSRSIFPLSGRIGFREEF